MNKMLYSEHLQHTGAERLLVKAKQNCHMMAALSKGYLSTVVWIKTVFLRCVSIRWLLHLPVEVKGLQQLDSVFSARNAVWRSGLHQLRAHCHILKHQQGPDSKPTPEDRVGAYTKHLLQGKQTG